MSAYPKEWERNETLGDGMRVLLRPLKSEDGALYPEFFRHVTPEDARLRFFHPISQPSPAMIRQFVELDYDRTMAFVAIRQDKGELLGVSRLHCDQFRSHGEYAVIVRSDHKRRGLGRLLMHRIIDWGSATGLERVHGQVFGYNQPMLKMCEEFGFVVTDDPSDRDVKVVTLHLKKA
jgi:acetyltransferase